jgi:Concanavalin A-like lectin/glucanases superfamily
MKRTLALTLCLAVFCAAAHAADLAKMADAVTYYQGCESLKRTMKGENVHPNPKLQDGKIGKSFLIERRWARNEMSDAEFTRTPKSAWLPIGEPEWLKAGGSSDGNCVKVDGENYLRQAVTKLKDKKLYCLSVYAKSEAGGRLEMSVKSGATSESFTSEKLTGDYQRLKLPFVTGATAATITLKGADATAVIIDAAQLEYGKSWPRTFNPRTRKVLSTEWVDIPATPEVFNPMKGTIAFWTKPQWLAEESVGGMAFFSARTDEPYKTYREKKNFVAIGAYRRPGKKGWQNGLNIAFRDNQATSKGVVAVSFEKPTLEPNQWMHLVVAWEIATPDKDSLCTTYLNGKKVSTYKFRLKDEIKPPTTIKMGHSGGAYADALMDEFYIFNRPLTADEAAALYALEKPLK